MNTYRLSCKKDTGNIDPKVIKTKNRIVYNTNRDRMKDTLWNAFN